MKSASSCVFVAIVSGQIVGYLIGNIGEAVSYKNIEKQGELENMFVLEEYRNLGIGSKLANKFVEWCKLNKLKRIRTEASAQNKKAIDFYRRNGFEDFSLVLEGNI